MEPLLNPIKSQAIESHCELSSTSGRKLLETRMASVAYHMYDNNPIIPKGGSLVPKGECRSLEILYSGNRVGEAVY
jgi:hypothetical protein